MSTAGACVSKCTQVHEYYSSQSPKTRSLSTDRCLCSSASHMPPKRKGRAQPRLDVPKYKLLRQPMSLLGTQVKFPGSFWEGRKLCILGDYICVAVQLTSPGFTCKLLTHLYLNTLFIFMSTGRRDYSYSWIPDVMTTHTQQYKLPKDELSYSL